MFKDIDHKMTNELCQPWDKKKEKIQFEVQPLNKSQACT